MKKVFEQQIRHLEIKHRNLDAEVGLLSRQTHMTPEEYQLCRELKKHKLRAKDGIEALRQAASA